MNKKRLKIALDMAFLIMGIAASTWIWYMYDWKLAAALFLLFWSNNHMISSK